MHTYFDRAVLSILFSSFTLLAQSQSNNFGYPVVPNTTSSIQAPVGSIDGSMTVSASGGATYSMPIEVPKGIVDFEPSIGISYNSQSVNGIAGWGCNLTGVSAITRTAPDIYHDGKAGGITYETSGPFCLDGQRLVKWSDIMNEDSVYYHPEYDLHTTVVLHGLSGSGVSQTTLWFSVLTPDGVYREYGHSSDSQQSFVLNGIVKVNSWHLSDETNPQGAMRHYSYVNWDNSLFLQDISYCNNVVRFAYETRPDVIRGSILGVPVLIAKRLACVTSATIVNGTDSIYRKYTLHYTNSDQTTTSYSRLERVTVANGNDETLRPTTFNWIVPAAFSCQKETPNFDYSFNYLGTQRSSISVFAADFNNDGLVDIAQYGRTNQPHASQYDFNYIQLHYGQFNQNGTLYFQGGETINLGNNMSIGHDEHHLGWNCTRTTPVAFDINADGVAELLVPEYYFSEDGSYFGFHAYKNGNHIGGVKYADVHTTETKNILWTAGDFNNDGTAEFVVLEKQSDGINYYGAIMGGYQDPGFSREAYCKPFRFYLPNRPLHVFSSDMNSDGLTDIVVFYDHGYSIFYNSNSWLDGNLSSTCYPSSTYYSLNICPIKAWQGDFNGDGISDFLVCAPNDHNFYFELGNGDGTFSQSVACTLEIYDQPIGADDDSFFCEVFDMDGDGKSDAIVHKSMYAPMYLFSKIYWLRSNGNNLITQSTAYSTSEAEGEQRFYTVGDFNGDGLAELASYSFDCYSDDGTGSDVAFRIYKNASFQPSSGKITRVTDGLDRQTHVAYNTTTEANVRMDESETGLSFPVIKVSAPLAVVSSVSTDNGAAGRNKLSYRYGRPLAHIQGRGMIGMPCSSVEDSITGMLTRSRITQWDSNSFLPMQTKDTITLNGHTAYKTTQYQVWLLTHGTSRVFRPITENIYTKDFNGNWQSEYFSYAYNWTFPYSHAINYNGQSERSTFIYDCVYKAKHYLPTIVYHDSRNGNNSTIRTCTRYAYNDIGLVDTLINYDETDKAITTVYTYDEYGNRLSETIKGGGQSLTIGRWEYDLTHRFVKRYIKNGLTDIRYTHDLWGHIISETDSTRAANPQSRTYAYDGWGQLTGSVSPIGLRTTYTYGWGLSQSKRWFKVVQGDAQPWIKTWYDATGREVSSESIGCLNLAISKTTSYNSKGLVSSEKERQGDIATTKTYSYDYQGRITSSSLTDSLGTLNQTATYTYGSNWMSENRDGRVTKTTFDSWGNPLTVETPQDTVSYTYNSLGRPISVTACGRTVSMEYDIMGNQTSLTDPDAGTITYTYDGLGRIFSQKNARNQTLSYHYDSYGRLLSGPLGGAISVVYNYGTSSSQKGLLLSETNNAGGYKTYFEYDTYGRVTRERRTVTGGNYRNFVFTYNTLGQMATKTYPNGVKVSYQYDAYGNHISTMKGDTVIWQFETSTGSIGQWRIGGSFHKHTTMNAMGLPTAKSILNGNTLLHSMAFAYDTSKGDLTQRTGMLGIAENFSYDIQDRLISITCGTGAQNITYTTDGNITSKTGIGDYYYEGAKPHAVTSVDNEHWLLPERLQAVAYNSMGKATSLIEEGRDTLTISYGPDGLRRRSFLKENGYRVTMHYLGDYEERIDSSGTESICYLDGGVLIVHQNDGTEQLYVSFSDHLGSVTRIYDETGQMKFNASYDAWGNQTIYRNEIRFRRGYTGHEMLPEFGLINMNGRFYDPLLGRFLSTDDYVQAPFDSQSFNRYSYCLNNPLKYTDPDGEIWWIPILASVCMNAAISRANGDGLVNGALKGLATSAVSLAGSYATNMIGNTLGHQLGGLGTEIFRAGAHGLIQGAVSDFTGGNFFSAFASGSLSSLAGSGLSSLGASSDMNLLGMGTIGGLTSSFTGGDFFEGFMSGLNIGALNHKWEILPDGTPHCILDDVVVTGINKSRIASLSYVAAMSGAKSIGYLTAYNSNRKIIFETKAVSGSSQKYRTLPPGNYDVTQFCDSHDNVFTRKGVGFKVIIGSDPYDKYLQRVRTLLRIHPARGNGTLGCIGLISNNTDSLLMMERMFSSSLKSNNPIPLYVIINDY